MTSIDKIAKTNGHTRGQEAAVQGFERLEPRMAKLHQEIAGCLHALPGARRFACLRGTVF